MPMHDWTKVDPDVYHDFSLNWNVACSRVINQRLPKDHFALIEKFPDEGFRQKRVAIRHELRERIVAIVELVSPGNKHSVRDFKQFRAKVVESLQMGIHAILIDPFLPTPRDPKGIHASIWKKLTGRATKTSSKYPLSNVSYKAAFGEDVAYYCYSKPGAVGEACPELPLFLQPGSVVAVDFEEIYNDAYADVLPRFRAKLEE